VRLCDYVTKVLQQHKHTYCRLWIYDEDFSTTPINNLTEVADVLQSQFSGGRRIDGLTSSPLRNAND